MRRDRTLNRNSRPGKSTTTTRAIFRRTTNCRTAASYATTGATDRRRYTRPLTSPNSAGTTNSQETAGAATNRSSYGVPITITTHVVTSSGTATTGCRDPSRAATSRSRAGRGARRNRLSDYGTGLTGRASNGRCGSAGLPGFGTYAAGTLARNTTRPRKGNSGSGASRGAVSYRTGPNKPGVRNGRTSSRRPTRARSAYSTGPYSARVTAIAIDRSRESHATKRRSSGCLGSRADRGALRMDFFAPVLEEPRANDTQQLVKLAPWPKLLMRRQVLLLK